MQEQTAVVEAYDRGAGALPYPAEPHRAIQYPKLVSYNGGQSTHRHAGGNSFAATVHDELAARFVTWPSKLATALGRLTSRPGQILRQLRDMAASLAGFAQAKTPNTRSPSVSSSTTRTIAASWSTTSAGQPLTSRTS